LPSEFNFVNDLFGKNSTRTDPEARTVRGTTAPQTLTRTDHALSIRIKGQTIGHIQGWNPQQSRPVDHVYEINAAAPGVVCENSPGALTGLTIGIDRIDLYTKKMENCWGPNFDIVMLTDQNNPFSINERWDNPDGSIEMYTYTGCWFNSLGRAHSAQGDRITRANATLTYVRKYKVGEIKSRIEETVDGIVKNVFG